MGFWGTNSPWKGIQSFSISIEKNLIYIIVKVRLHRMEFLHLATYVFFACICPIENKQESAGDSGDDIPSGKLQQRNNLGPNPSAYSHTSIRSTSPKTILNKCQYFRKSNSELALTSSKCCCTRAVFVECLTHKKLSIHLTPLRKILTKLVTCFTFIRSLAPWPAT